MAEPEQMTPGADEAPPVRAVPAPLPDVVRIAGDAPLRFTPNELAMIRAQTGQTITDLLDGDERWSVIAWLKIRRLGFPSVQWDDLGEIEIELVATEGPEPRDPTDARSSTTSPPSAGIGA